MDKDNLKTTIAVSNRHVHLSRKDIDLLFGKGYELTTRRFLSPSKTEFSAEETVTLINKEKQIENVRVVGPEREYTQIELSKTDANNLKIPAPIRNSGDLEGTPGMTLKGTQGIINLDSGVIIAQRHIHVKEDSLKQLGISPGDKINIQIDDMVVKDIVVKEHPECDLIVHIDKDDAKITGIQHSAIGNIISK